MTNFPVIDRPEHHHTDGRIVIDHLGHIEPRIDETDGWYELPIRLVLNQGVGLCIEVGPYELDEHDIAALAAAIDTYRTNLQLNTGEATP